MTKKEHNQEKLEWKSSPNNRWFNGWFMMIFFFVRGLLIDVSYVKHRMHGLKRKLGRYLLGVTRKEIDIVLELRHNPRNVHLKALGLREEQLSSLRLINNLLMVYSPDELTELMHYTPEDLFKALENSNKTPEQLLQEIREQNPDPGMKKVLEEIYQYWVNIRRADTKWKKEADVQLALASNVFNQIVSNDEMSMDQFKKLVIYLYLYFKFKLKSTPDED